jgi:hypothetical protein
MTDLLAAKRKRLADAMKREGVWVREYEKTVGELPEPVLDELIEHYDGRQSRRVY